MEELLVAGVAVVLVGISLRVIVLRRRRMEEARRGGYITHWWEG